MFALAEAVQVALIVTGGSVLIAGLPIASILINKLVRKAVASGTDAVLTKNTQEHLENAVKLDAITSSLGVQDATLARVEDSVLRQAEVISDHLSWHLHAPLVTPITVVPSGSTPTAGG